MASKYDSEIIEPEEQIRGTDYNPLDEMVNEKSYSQLNVNAAASDLNKPIDEPRFTPPPLQSKTIPQNEETRKREPINPEMKQLPKKETEMAASHMAKLLLNGYEWMHQLANKGLQVSEKKLTKLQAEGEINLNAMIDYDYGKQMRAGDFFKDYNEQVGDVLKVTDEFKEEVTPVLERVLAKRGVGMTDEQLLMFMFGKDIATKSMIFFQQKTQLNYMIQSIKEATTSQYAQQAPPQPKQSYTPPPDITPEPPPQQQYQEDYSVKEKTNGIKPDIIVMPKRQKRPQGRPKG